MNSRIRTLKTLIRAARDLYARHHQSARWLQQGVSLSPEAIVMVDERSELVVHPGASIGRHTILNLRSHRKDPNSLPGRLEIGERTAVLEFNNIRAGGGEIRIGPDCIVSQYVTIIATNHLV